MRWLRWLAAAVTGALAAGAIAVSCAPRASAQQLPSGVPVSPQDIANAAERAGVPPSDAPVSVDATLPPVPDGGPMRDSATPMPPPASAPGVPFME